MHGAGGTHRAGSAGRGAPGVPGAYPTGRRCRQSAARAAPAATAERRRTGASAAPPGARANGRLARGADGGGAERIRPGCAVPVPAGGHGRGRRALLHGGPGSAHDRSRLSVRGSPGLCAGGVCAPRERRGICGGFVRRRRRRRRRAARRRGAARPERDNFRRRGGRGARIRCGRPGALSGAGGRHRRSGTHASSGPRPAGGARAAPALADRGRDLRPGAALGALRAGDAGRLRLCLQGLHRRNRRARLLLPGARKRRCRDRSVSVAGPAAGVRTGPAGGQGTDLGPHPLGAGGRRRRHCRSTRRVRPARHQPRDRRRAPSHGSRAYPGHLRASHGARRRHALHSHPQAAGRLSRGGGGLAGQEIRRHRRAHGRDRLSHDLGRQRLHPARLADAGHHADSRARRPSGADHAQCGAGGDADHPVDAVGGGRAGFPDVFRRHRRADCGLCGACRAPERRPRRAKRLCGLGAGAVVAPGRQSGDRSGDHLAGGGAVDRPVLRPPFPPGGRQRGARQSARHAAGHLRGDARGRAGAADDAVRSRRMAAPADGKRGWKA